MDVGDRSFVFLSFIMKACPPIRAYSHHKHKHIECTRTNSIAATREHLCRRDASSDSQFECQVVSIESVDTSEPGQHRSMGRAHVKRARHERGTEESDMRVQVH